MQRIRGLNFGLPMLLLLAICLVVVAGPASAAPSTTEHRVVNNVAVDPAYIQNVVLPAKQAGRMTEEMRSALTRFTSESARSAGYLPNRDRNGGPDDGGYVWMDTDDGASFEWIDVSEMGRRLEPGDDWNSGRLDLGWSFNFYGTDYDGIYICSNGWASFTSQQTWFTGNNFPNGNRDYAAMLAAQPFDLYPPGGGSIYFYTNPDERMAVISWDGIPGYNGEEASWFQIVLMGDNSVKFQYAESNDPTGENVIAGIQNAAGDIGLTAVSQERGRLVEGMAIWFGLEDQGEPPAISVNPQSIETELNTGEMYSEDVVIGNGGEGRLRWSTDAEIVAEPERDRNGRNLRGVNEGAVGPRRDPPESRFALFKEEGGWGDNMEEMWGNQGIEIDQYNSDAFANAPIEDYDVIWIREYQSDRFNQNWNNNRARFEDWVDEGGVLYHGVGTNNWQILPVHVGGLQRNQQGSGNGQVVVTNDPGADNYSFLAELCGWRGNEVLPGSSWSHSSYNLGDLQNIENSDYYQVQAINQGQANFPGVVVYNYGRGWSMVSGTTDSHQYNNFRNQGNWGWALPFVPLYLDFLANTSQWLSWSPEEGSLESGEEVAMEVTLNAEGLIEGNYEADLHVLSNDQENPDIIVNVSMFVHGAPDIFVEWDDAFGEEGIDINAGFLDVFNTGHYPVVLTVVNEGTADLEVNGIDPGNDAFTVDRDQFVLGAGDEQEVVVTFHTEEANVYEAEMVFSSNDPDQGEFIVVIRGESFDPPLIEVDPTLVEVDNSEEEVIIRQVTLSNVGDAPLRWDTELEVIAMPERDDNGRQLRAVNGGTPVRDELDLEDMRFAVFQTDGAWGSIYDPIINNGGPLNRENFVLYSNPEDLVNVDFSEYNAIMFATGEQWSWQRTWNDAVARIEEYVDNGGGAYFEMGNYPWEIDYRAPGGISNNIETYSSNGILLVSPDDGADNYSAFAAAAHEYQPNYWNEGETIEGSSFLHSGFETDQFQRLVDDGVSDWYQVIADHEDNRGVPGVINYSFGGGLVMVVGHPTGHCWNWYNEEGMWGSIAPAILYYLATGGSPSWIEWEPTEGVIESGADQDMFITVNTVGLREGDYEADLHILSNDPNDGDVAVSIVLTVIGIPDIAVEWELGMENNTITWNDNFIDVFTGFEYGIPVTIVNEGSGTLTINDISADQQVFWSDPNQLEIPPFDEAEVMFYVQTEDNGVYEGIMTISSDDPNEGSVDISLVAQTFSPPELVLDPTLVEDALLTGERNEWILDLSNEGGSELRYETDLVILQEPERDANGRSLRGVNGSVVGPTRDDLGDEIGRFAWNRAGQFQYKAGIAYDWDNDLFLLTTYSPNWCAIVDPNDEFRVVREWQPQGNPMGAAWLDGVFYMVVWANQFLMKYDVDGNNLGQHNVNFPATAVTASQEMGLLVLIDGNNAALYFQDIENNRVSTWNQGDYFGMVDNRWPRSLLWMDKHPDGQLWMGYAGRINQILVNDDLRPVQRVASYAIPNANNPQDWDGIGHDKTNLYWGGYGEQQYRILDDGITEAYWLSYGPEEATIAAGANIEFVVTLDAAGLLGGTYEADIHFLSNDPANADIVLNVNLEVTGAPDIAVEWDMGMDQNSINWNEYHQDLFTGGPYVVPVTIINEGTDDLEVRDISSDNGFFTCDPSEFVIAAREELVVNFILNAEEDGVHEGIMTITSNDNDEETIDIMVVGTTSAPPVIFVEPNEINENNDEQDTEEFVVTISNEGDALLRWTAEAELFEPERDANRRSLRGIDGSVVGPARDNPGELIAQFNGPNVINQYWSPIGYNKDENYMAIAGYSVSQVAIWTHDNYANFREVRRYGTPNPMDGGVYEGQIYHCNLNNTTVLRRFDFNGNQLQEVNMGYAVYGLAFDNEEGLMFAREQQNQYAIRVYQMNGNLPGQQIGQIVNWQQYTNGNVNLYNIEWVPKHPEGQLWINNPNVGVHQILVNTDNWQPVREVQRFNVATQQPYDAVAHDGYNMWVGGYANANIRIYDDGVTESYWLSFDPKAGEIEAGSSGEIIVTLNSIGVNEGVYEADLHILNNDPANPDVVVHIVYSVTGYSDITLDWDMGMDQNFIDFNEYYPDLFTGGRYEVPIMVINDGTADLDIHEISTDNEVFSVDQDNMVIGIGEEAVLTLILATDQDGVYEGILTFLTNDRDEEEVNIEIRGETGAPPIIVVDPNSIEENLVTGETMEIMLDISNDGGSPLRWESDIEVISVPDRDNSRRSLRAVDGRQIVPTRDEVDIEGMRFAVFQTNSVWGWLDDGLRDTDDLLDGNNVISYRNANDWNNVDFSEFDVICVSSYSQQFNVQYANNLERFEEYVADGGAAYFETGNVNQAILSPGGIYNDANVNSSNGILVVSPNPNDDDYSLFAEICQSTQPNNWNRGEVIEGSSWLHSGYTVQQFDNKLNNGTIEWYQTIAVHQNNQAIPGAVAYGYGRGTVMTVGHPSAHCWFWYNQIGMWGSIGSELLYYLTEASGPNWVEVVPAEGEIAAHSNGEAAVILNAEGLIGGDYVADIHFLSNDIETPDFVVDVTMHVRGAPAVETEPLAHPLVGAVEVLEFADTYVDGRTSMEVIIMNVGTEDMEIFGTESANNDFSADLNDGVVLGPDDARTFSILFHPTDIGMREGRISIFTNAENVDDGTIWFDVAGLGETPPTIVTNPADGGWIRVGLPLGQGTVDRSLVIMNDGGEGADDLLWSISVEEIENQGRDNSERNLRNVHGNVGPRRDDPPESRFLLVQETNPWGWDLERDFAAIEANYDRLRTPNQIDQVDLDDYDVVYFGNYESDQWNQMYNDRFDRIAEYVDGGGTYYMCTGTNNYGVAPRHPGGLVRSPEGAESVGFTVPEREENWLMSYLGWDRGHQVNGSSFNHVVYDVNNLNNIENNEGYEVIFITERGQRPVMAVYDFGRGICVVSGCTDGFLQANYNRDGEWGQAMTRGAHLYYLDFLANNGPSWLELSHDEGTLANGESDEVVLTFNTEDLEANSDHWADLMIESNDPNQPVTMVHVQLHVGSLGNEHFVDFAQTDQNHSLLVTNVTFDDEVVAGGWEVGAFTPGGVLSGAGVWQGEEFGMAVWGADDAHQDQFHNGEEIGLMLWDNEADMEWNARAIVEDGDMNWQANGLTVLAIEGFSASDCVVSFRAGWNLISINVVPSDPNLYTREEGPDVVRMMAQIRRPDGGAHHLILMKNERGQFYTTLFGGPNGFNGIPFWNLQEGYQVRVDEELSTTWSGAPIPADADVPIARGWNMIAYFPTYELEASRASNNYVISPIRDFVVIAKDGAGNFMVPSRNGFSNMPPWRPGQGYQINVSQDVTLNYPAEREVVAAVGGEAGLAVKGRWTELEPTGSNMSVLITKVSGVELSTGDQVAAFSPSGRQVGAGSVVNGMIGLAIWGDDKSTNEVDGLADGEAFVLKLWDADKEAEINLGVQKLQLGNGLVYEQDAFTVLEARLESALPTEYYMSQNYPNPFNAVTRVAFGLPEASKISIKVFDVAGRQVANLVEGELKAGHHNVVWNGEGSSAGVYIMRMEAPGFSSVRKVMLVK